MPAPIIAVAQPEDEDQEQPTSPLIQRSSGDDDENGGSASSAPSQPAAPPSSDPASGYEASAMKQMPTMPNVPQAPPQAPAQFSPDASRLQQLQSKVEQDRQPVKVSPKWYDRVAGALVGFGVGYKGGALQGMEAGSAITNRRQEAQDDQQARQLTADEGAISDFNAQNALALQANDSNQRGYENQIRSRELSDTEQNQQADRDFRAQQASREQANSDRDFNQRKANDDRNYERQLDEDQWAHGNADRTYSLEKQRVGIGASGQSAEAQAYADAKAAWQRSNPGRLPTLADISAIQRAVRDSASPSNSPIGDQEAQAIVADATARKEKFADQYDRQSDGSYVDGNGNRVDAKRFAQMIDAYRTDANKKLARLGYEINENGEMVRPGAMPAPTGQQVPSAAAPTGAQQPARSIVQPAPAQQPAQPSAHANPAANLPMGKGRSVDKDTARQFLSAAGGDKTRARQLAAQNGWKF